MKRRVLVKGTSTRQKVLRRRRMIYERFADTWEARRLQAAESPPTRKDGGQEAR